MVALADATGMRRNVDDLGQSSVDFEKSHAGEAGAVAQDVAQRGAIVRVVAPHRKLESGQILSERIAPVPARQPQRLTLSSSKGEIKRRHVDRQRRKAYWLL